ncbi:MAG: trigger factor [Clostridiales bacterium]|jgi:trigger factor|nr:trigger factor [Clostridiales bacterium]
MTSQISPGEKNHVILEIETAAEELALEYRLAVKKLGAKANIPGFRRGKVPQAVLESFIGVEVLLHEAADALVQRDYPAAVKEHMLKPLGKAEVEIVQLAKEQPFIFKATVMVEPQAKLGQYKGLTGKKLTRKASEEDIDRAIEQKRQRLAKWTEAAEDAELAKGDIAIFDFAGIKDGIPFPGGSAEDYSLEIGSGRFIPGFEEQMPGMVIGGERILDLTFPENYSEPSLAGEAVQFKVNLKGIKQKELPELDDAFAQEVSETADTIDQLREETRAKLDEDFAGQSEQTWRNQVVMDAVANAEVDIPLIMIEKRMDDLHYDIVERLRQQRIEPEDYLEKIGIAEYELREQSRSEAEMGVRLGLVMTAIVLEENIELSEEDLEKELTKLAESQNQPLAVIRQAVEKSGYINNVIDRLKLDKAMELICDTAVIMEEEYDPEADPETDSKEDTEEDTEI